MPYFVFFCSEQKRSRSATAKRLIIRMTLDSHERGTRNQSCSAPDPFRTMATQLHSQWHAPRRHPSLPFKHHFNQNNGDAAPQPEAPGGPSLSGVWRGASATGALPTPVRVNTPPARSKDSCSCRSSAGSVARAADVACIQKVQRSSGVKKKVQDAALGAGIAVQHAFVAMWYVCELQS